MTRKESDKLKIGQRVQIWAGQPIACTGTISEKNWMAAKIEWDDGQIGTIHLNDFKNVDLYAGDKPIIPAAESA